MKASTAIPAHRSGLRLLRDVRRNPLNYFTTLMREEGPYAWLSLNGRPLLMLNDATGIQHVLKSNAKNYHKAKFSQVLKPLLGNGIFLSEGSIWEKQRIETAPVFATGNFKDMMPEMVAAAGAMLERWQPSIHIGKPIDLRLEFMRFTLDVLLRTLFHVSNDSIAENIQETLGILLREAEGRIWSAANIPHSIIMRIPKYRYALDYLRRIVSDLVIARRENKTYPKDLLSRLIDSYDDSSPDQARLRDQVMSFLLAGHETTAHGLAWSFYNLALHPEYRQKMEIEADNVLGARTPELEDIRKLQYTGNVFNEALRLYPPVWTMSRASSGADQIPLDSGEFIDLPANTAVMLCGYAVHRREAYWNDPEAFNPDRFLPIASSERPEFSWIPFGGGPRLCLGFRFAHIESVVAMAMIAQRYSMTILPGQSIKPLPIITLRPSHPILFRIEPRNKHNTISIQHSFMPQPSSETLITEPPTKCPFHRHARAS